MRKRLISLCMVLVLCLSLLPITVLAASNSYVALGDSITTGYGLGSEEQSFAKIVADKNGYDLNTLAADGATSGNLLGVVTAPANAETLKNAGLITITIGGNDLMGALYSYLAEAYNTTNGTSFTGEDMQLALMGTHPTINQIAALLCLSQNLAGFVNSGMGNTLSEFQTNLSSILQKLKELNPTAQIIVTNQYNPYGILENSNYASLVEQFETGIGKLNNAISEVCKSLGVTVADVHTSFAEALDAGENPCNASVAGGTINPDFHPNAYGHELIAAAIADKLPEPDPEVEPNIYVGGVGLYGDENTTAYAKTDENGQVITQGATANDYNISWDGETLTLKNADIQNRYTFNKYDNQVVIYSEKQIKVELIGTNTLAVVGEEKRYVYGIQVEGDIAFSGKGTLEITVRGGTASYGLISENTTISGGSSLTIEDTGKISNGACIGGSLTISDGSALISAVTDGFDGAIDVDGNIVISGGSKLTGKSAGEKGINVDGSLTVSDGSKVAATASGEKARGICVGSSMTVTNSEVYAKGESSGLIVDGILTVNDRQEAIQSNSEVWISVDGTVTWSGEYPLWVGDTQVNDENADNVLGDGTVSYDIVTNTLTLRNATITQGTHEESAICGNSDLNIVLEGENTVNAGIIGIYVNGTLAISGSGSLTVNGINIKNGDIIISSGTITTSKAYEGIIANNVTISGGTVTATGDTLGISTYSITISGGTVTATGDTLGISTYSITISGGTVTAMGGTMGIYDEDSITIAPKSGQQIAVTVGTDENSARAIYGSPFRGETDIEDLIAEANYFHSETSVRTSSGGGGGGSGNNTETEKNPDGSTTTTVTKPDGSTTETTKWPDGSKEVIETKKDGTVTTTTTDKNGNQTEVVENPDGSSKTTVDNKDGSSSVTTVDEDGKVEAEVKLPADLVEDAQEKGEAVTLPMPEVPVTTDRDEAPTVTVDLPSGTAVQVEIPVKRVTFGTVAVLVKDNGTEEVIKTSLTTENGVAVTLSDGDTVKIVDNSKTFTDVPGSYWGSEYIDFVTSREIFSGTGGNTFSPDASMTRGMIVTVLAAYDGADTSSNGGAWYEAGRQWAMANGISDGTNMDSALTREQLAVMLCNYAGKPTAGSLSGYTDAASVSDWAVQAMAWCVEQGIISGMDGGLNPQGTATRAQVATMLMQFCQLGK